MNEQRIKEIRESKDKARRRQERNYQESGIGSYQSKARQYEEIVDICDIALSVARERDEARAIKAELMMIAEQAYRAEKNCHGCGNETPVVLNKVLQMAKKYGCWRDPRG